MKLSIIMNSLNENEIWLRQAIESNLAQTGVDIELILSTIGGDNSIKVGHEYGIKVAVTPKAGIYAQINNALKEATGDWYTYSSSNDVVLLSKAADEIALCQESHKMICYSAYYECDEQLNITRLRTFYDYDYNIHITGKNFVSDLAMVNIAILHKYQPFNEVYGNMAHYDFWLRVAEGENNVFVYNNKPEWKYRLSSASQHIKREKDARKIAENEMMRAKMLKDHRG